MKMSILLRISQLNAVYLDREIYNALKRILQYYTNSLPSSILVKFEHEFNLLLQLGILNYSIISSGSTFGQQLLSIKYEEISKLKRWIYALYYCNSYFKEKLEHSLPSHRLNEVAQKIFVIIKLLDFVNFSIFLCKGEKPLLIERFLGLKQVYADGSGARTFNSKYLAKELLWNSFIEIMIHVVPLINFYKLKRIFRDLNPFHKKKHVESLERVNLTFDSKCAFCGRSPVIPHHMGCAHVYCYYCLRGNLEADSKFSCPVCGHWNENILCEAVTL